MRIDLKKIRQNLRVLKRRSHMKKGEQPELVLGCFLSEGFDGTKERCEKCKHYEPTCKLYLSNYEIEENPFQIHRDEIYRQMTAKENI